MNIYGLNFYIAAIENESPDLMCDFDLHVVSALYLVSSQQAL